MENISDVNTNSIAPRWLDWAREIQALAQTGYHYAENDFQRERNQRLSSIAAEIISAQSDLELAPVVNLFREQIGYATPRVDVRGAVFRDNRLLLVREREDGDWTLPGGWADVGDVPSQAAEREVWEEAGFRVRARRVIGVYDANRVMPMELFHAFKIIFLCDMIGGSARPGTETCEVKFFSLNEVPEALSGERTRMRHIIDAFNFLSDESLPTVFD